MSLSAQFAEPHGLMGALVGRIMWKVNAGQARQAVNDLACSPGEQVLEIGFGPGAGLAALASGHPGADLFGADPSSVMVRAACRRLSRNGCQADLRQAAAAVLPWPEDSFDAVFAVNNAQLWEPLSESLTEVRRVLRPGGRIVLSVHELGVLKGGGYAGPDYDETLVPAVRGAGFQDVTAEWRPSKSKRALTVRAIRP